MLRPTLRAVLVGLALLPLAALPVLVDRSLWTGWAVAAAGFAVLLALDAAGAASPGSLAIEVSAPDTLAIGSNDGALELRIVGSQRFATRLEGIVEADPILAPPPPFEVALPVGADLRVRVPLVAARRGTARIQTLWLRWQGPLRLLAWTVRRPLRLTVAAVPNIRPVRQLALRFASERDFRSGLKTERYEGDGTEFESLRDYVPGYSPRSIDWKGTARLRKLVCREYRAERNHPVVIAFDTGHLMAEPLDGVPKLDRAATAGLLLAYMAIKTGDRVGLLAFDDEVRLWDEPAAGMPTFHRFQRRMGELRYSTAETNFTLALTDLSARLRRRTLVVILTDFADSTTAELMVDHLRRLARRHVVVCVAMADAELEREAWREARDVRALGRSVAARELVAERATVFERLHRAGVQCIDAPWQRVDTALLQRYLDIQRRELVG